MRTHTLLHLTLALAAAVVVREVRAATNDHLGRAIVACDFDADGFDDLAIGAPGETVARTANAGVVHVVFGAKAGANVKSQQAWNENKIGVSPVEAGEGFGSVLAAGDFDGDGFCDLAIGVPGRSGAVAPIGGVIILTGSPRGLTAANAVVFDQDSNGMIGGSDNNDRFGAALATGDFDGDGFTDLAIGVPGHNAGKLVAAGGVDVLHGGRAGLSTTNAQLWQQGANGLLGTAAAGAAFGSALAAADFDNDGFVDLAIGAPRQKGGGAAAAGTVNALYGSNRGLGSARNQLWDEKQLAVAGGAAGGDHFGAALAGGDFDGDGFADLAVGVPDRDVNKLVDAGNVDVIYSNRNGLAAAGVQVWDQKATGIGFNRASDRFGSVLATALFNSDAFADLAVGVPLRTVGTIRAAGIVNVLYGSRAKLTAKGAQLWHASVPRLVDSAAKDDHFGSALASGKLNGDNLADLAIGVPDKDVKPEIDAGAVDILYGAAAALTTNGNQMLTPASLKAAVPNPGP